MNTVRPSITVALAGGVSSSRRTLIGLVRNHVQIKGVLGLAPNEGRAVSGYCRMDVVARNAGIPYYEFSDINESQVTRMLAVWQPDLLFVVGLSQIVKRDVLVIPRRGCVGFHPTALPEGRGRAPIAWLTLEEKEGAATFFLMDENVDAGPILFQEPFRVSQGNTAADVMQAMELAIDRGLDKWLPTLIAGEWNPTAQDDQSATYYGKRAPEDGLINWNWSAHRILKFIQATSRPHPGAYTYLGVQKVIIWQSEIAVDLRFTGVVGRILLRDPKRGPLVQTGDGLLWLTEYQCLPESERSTGALLRVGIKLGYASEDEIYALKKTIQVLAQEVEVLKQLLDRRVGNENLGDRSAS